MRSRKVSGWRYWLVWMYERGYITAELTKEGKEWIDKNYDSAERIHQLPPKIKR